MRKFLPILFLGFLAMTLATPSWAASTVLVVRVKGIINAGVSQYLMRGLKSANDEKAQALIVTLDTPGGLLNFTREILATFGNSEIPIVVYVSPAGASATSAGALIAQGAHVIAMAPGTNMGAAHPVGGQGEDVKGAMGEKVVNDTVAMAKSMATLRGRDPKWIEEAIRKSVSATAEEAVKLKAAEFVAKDEATLFEGLEGRSVTTKSGTIVFKNSAAWSRKELPMTAAEKVLQFLGDPNVLYLLMAAGGLGLYAELSTPGIGVAGVISAICFVLAFISMQTLPVSTGAIVLLVLGIVLLIAEVFVTSYGILGIGGIISLVLGALFMLDPSTGDLRVSVALVVWVSALVGVLSAALGYLVMKTRKVKYRGLDHIEGVKGTIEIVNPDGRSGKVFVWGETWNFELEEKAPHSPLQRGDQVEIVSRAGLKLSVRKGS